MKNNSNRFWFLVLFLGWSFDFLFWKKPAGINFFIYMILCLVVGIYLLNADGLRLSPRSRLLLFPIALLSAVTFIRQEPMTTFLSVSMSLFFMGLFTLTYINGQWMQYGLVDYIQGFLRLLGSIILRPLEFSTEVRKNQPSLDEKRSTPIWSVLRGIIIALPVIAIFASLLSSADPIFGKRFKDFVDLFRVDNLPEYIFRLVYILFFAYALAGIFLHAAQKSGEEYKEKSLFAPFLGFTESSIVLGSVVILFVAFVFVQFQYFFGGNANINIEGYTYSEYARKGFGELVTVAFFSLLLLLGLGAITRRETDNQRRVFSVSGVTLVGLVIVMLVSAFQRLGLYEIAYGFSRLRMYTHVFMIWLGMLLVAVVILELIRRERSIGLAMLLASFGFVVSLGLLNVDGAIVKRNVQREIQIVDGKTLAHERSTLDENYFLTLSDDAVPALAKAFTDTSLPDSIREEVGAVLACKLYSREQDIRERPWESFHLSRYKADSVFETIGEDLSVYKVVLKELRGKVETPSGNIFYCWQYSY